MDQGGGCRSRDEVRILLVGDRSVLARNLKDIRDIKKIVSIWS